MKGGEGEGTVVEAKTAGRRPISRRRRLAFIAVILAALAGAQELLFRWLFPVPEVADFNRINYTRLGLFGPGLTVTRRRGLSNVKVRWESEPDGFAFDHTLNLYGFRGPTFPIDPPLDRPRILFVGDSFVEGCGAADADTLTEQFQRILGTGHPVEAVNLGVAAADFPEYALLVRDGVDLLKPRAVFLVLCANDLPAKPPPGSVTVPPTEWPRRSPWLPRALEVYGRHREGRAVPRRIPGGPYPFFAAVPDENNPLTFRKPPDNIDPAVLDAMRRGKANPWNAGVTGFYDFALSHDFKTDGAREYLAHLASLCRPPGVRLVVVYVPHYAAVNPLYLAAEKRLGGPGFGAQTSLDHAPYRNQQSHLRQVCGELALPFLDTTDAFIQAEQTGRLFWPIDGHCNADGYRLLAEVCARYWMDDTKK
jgi:lysophospholipase L1-like esterase